MITTQDKKGDIVIYQEDDGKTDILVTLYQDTLWLNLNQIAELFDRDKSVISIHLRKVYLEGELNKGATVAFFATVQNEGGRFVERRVEYFNLDAILSVGYRVNSKRGTQFRIWANNVLKEYLKKGYALNEKRLRGRHKELEALKTGILLLERSVMNQAHGLNQAQSFVNIIADFSKGLEILADLDNLPDPDLLASDIIENLESAVASFKEIMESINGK